MTVLLHIGFHKTATTWLQKSLFPRTDLGFSEPWGPRGGDGIDYFLARDADDFSETQARAFYAPEIAACKDNGAVPVISNEALSGQPNRARYYLPEMASRLVAVFPEARVLVGIREQTQLALSLYKQYLRIGGVHGLDRYLGTVKARAGFGPVFRLRHLDFFRAYSIYAELFGAHRVLIAPLEALRHDPRVFASRILTFSGLAELPTHIRVDPQPRNVALGAAALATRRFASRLQLDDPLGLRRSRSRALLDSSSRVIDRLIPQTVDRRVEARWMRTITRFIGDYFAESNGMLAQATGLDLSELGYPCRR